MTILEKEVEIDGGAVCADDLLDMEVEDEDGEVDAYQMLEQMTGLKLIKYIVENAKEVCKTFVGLTPSSEHKLRHVSDKVEKACEKHKRSQEKASKLLSKCFPSSSISCDGDVFKTLLKYGMNSGNNLSCGPRLIAILQAVFSVGAYAGRVSSPTLGIQMIVSHSSAADIFLEHHQNQKTGKGDVSKKVGNPKSSLPPAESESEVEKYSEIKTHLLSLWKHLVLAFTKVSKASGTENDKKILENSVPYLFQMYSASMSASDQEIFQILQEYTGKKLQISIESLSLFGPKCLEPPPNAKAANPLFAHSSKANTILGLISERQAFQTAMEYDESRGSEANNKHYDMRFLLPLVCHTLDARNICDAVKVISNGWIYFIVRCLSVEDPILRNVSFLAYKLLIQNFQLPKKGFKVQDIKVWLHFLLSVRRGLQNLGRCKISPLLSTWLVAAWECLRQPAHPMYQRLTTFLFAKPVIDLSIVPEFMPFFNATDGNKITREWVFDILSHGMKTREDWQVAQRLPTIHSLCSSFLVETVPVQREILRILTMGARIPEVAQEMVDKHSLLIWIGNLPIISDKNKSLLYRRELYNLFLALKDACVHNELRGMLFRFVATKHDWLDEDNLGVQRTC